MSDGDLLAAFGVELAPERLEWALADSPYVAEDEVLTNERLGFLEDSFAGFVVTDQLILNTRAQAKISSPHTGPHGLTRCYRDPFCATSDRQ